MEESKDTNEEHLEIIQKNDNILRIIFLTLLKIFFIILIYIYLSDQYGSVSSGATGYSAYFPFVASLCALAFLSNLAGLIPGLVSGLLGELLYQFAFYHEIYIHWCIILMIFGGICGVFKFKPLKYQDNKQGLYTILYFTIASLIAIGILIGFGYFTAVFNFFIQLITSEIFLVPLLLIVYDKVLSDKERHIYHEFLTHHPASASDHTFSLQFGRMHVYFCTRCSGFVIGALFSMFSTYLITLIFNIEISPEIAILTCIILPIPGLIDWGTQRLMLRKSTTESRLFTGFIIGIALQFMVFTKPYGGLLLFIIILYFGIFFVMMYFGAKKEMRQWREEWDQLTKETNELLDDTLTEPEIHNNEELDSE